jgi:hypothetical protein
MPIPFGASSATCDSNWSLSARRGKESVLKIIVAAVIAAGLLAVGAWGATSASAGNGQAIGQDPIRLALTRCSNAGGGNGGEFEAGIIAGGEVYSVLSECLHKRLGRTYSDAAIEAILAQANCYLFGPLAVCEIDPGNSAAHNNAGP